MRYWAYIGNEVKGPFEAGTLAAQPGFSASSMVCPENAVSSKNDGWKAASNFADIGEALSAPPAPAEQPKPAPRPAAAPPDLALTMRGSLIGDPEETPAAAPAPEVKKPASEDSPLALTMRGSLVSEPLDAAPPAKKPVPAAGPEPKTLPAAAPAAAPEPKPLPTAAPAARLEPLAAKLGELEASVSAAEADQARAAERLRALEQAVKELKDMLGREMRG